LFKKSLVTRNCKCTVFGPETFPGEVNDFASEQKPVEQSHSEDFIIYHFRTASAQSPAAINVLPTQVTIDLYSTNVQENLYTEEFRMITLMRLGKLVERVRKYNNDPFIPGLNIQDHNNLWPIPQDIIDLNIDAKMEQNPGY